MRVNFNSQNFLNFENKLRVNVKNIVCLDAKFRSGVLVDFVEKLVRTDAVDAQFFGFTKSAELWLFCYTCRGWIDSVENALRTRMTLRIACIGWGSLVWDPRGLPVSGDWRTDGPYLPIEFARESADGRITLVLCEGVALVRTYWTMLAVEDLAEAVIALAEREGIARRIAHDIGRWNSVDDKSRGMCAAEIAKWANTQGLDGVVWTNLPCGLRDSRGVMPTEQDVLAHLAQLSGESLENAKHYVEMAPAQIYTGYRGAIVSSLKIEALS
jgi:hypothetical protein